MIHNKFSKLRLFLEVGTGLGGDEDQEIQVKRSFIGLESNLFSTTEAFFFFGYA